MGPAENNKRRERCVDQSWWENKDALCIVWSVYHTNKLKLKGLSACRVVASSFKEVI